MSSEIKFVPDHVVVDQALEAVQNALGLEIRPVELVNACLSPLTDEERDELRKMGCNDVDSIRLQVAEGDEDDKLEPSWDFRVDREEMETVWVLKSGMIDHTVGLWVPSALAGDQVAIFLRLMLWRRVWSKVGRYLVPLGWDFDEKHYICRRIGRIKTEASVSRPRRPTRRHFEVAGMLRRDSEQEANLFRRTTHVGGEPLPDGFRKEKLTSFAGFPQARETRKFVAEEGELSLVLGAFEVGPQIRISLEPGRESIVRVQGRDCVELGQQVRDLLPKWREEGGGTRLEVQIFSAGGQYSASVAFHGKSSDCPWSFAEQLEEHLSVPVVALSWRRCLFDDVDGLQRHQRIRVVDLSNVAGLDAVKLGSLSRLHHVECLLLDDNNLDASLVSTAFSDPHNFPSLKVLSLSNTHVGSRDAEAFVKAIGNLPALNVLNLNSSGIRSSFILAFEDAVSKRGAFRKLRALKLRGATLDSTSEQILEREILRNKSLLPDLRFVDLTNASLNRGAILRFARACVAGNRTNVNIVGLEADSSSSGSGDADGSVAAGVAAPDIRFWPDGTFRSLFRYLQSQQETTTLHTAVAFLVGNSTDGKSTIARRLGPNEDDPRFDDERANAQNRTIGAELRTWMPKSRTSPVRSCVLYDFAGQEVFSSSNALFLCKDALFLLVVSLERKPESQQASIHRWCLSILHHAPDARIVILCTHPDAVVGREIPDVGLDHGEWKVVEDRALAVLKMTRTQLLDFSHPDGTPSVVGLAVCDPRRLEGKIGGLGAVLKQDREWDFGRRDGRPLGLDTWRVVQDFIESSEILGASLERLGISIMTATGIQSRGEDGHLNLQISKNLGELITLFQDNSKELANLAREQIFYSLADLDNVEPIRRVLKECKIHERASLCEALHALGLVVVAPGSTDDLVRVCVSPRVLSDALRDIFAYSPPLESGGLPVALLTEFQSQDPNLQGRAVWAVLSSFREEERLRPILDLARTSKIPFKTLKDIWHRLLGGVAKPKSDDAIRSLLKFFDSQDVVVCPTTFEDDAEVYFPCAVAEVLFVHDMEAPVALALDWHLEGRGQSVVPRPEEPAHGLQLRFRRRIKLTGAPQDFTVLIQKLRGSIIRTAAKQLPRVGYRVTDHSPYAVMIQAVEKGMVELRLEEGKWVVQELGLESVRIEVDPTSSSICVCSCLESGPGFPESENATHMMLLLALRGDLKSHNLAPKPFEIAEKVLKDLEEFLKVHCGDGFAFPVGSCFLRDADQEFVEDETLERYIETSIGWALSKLLTPWVSTADRERICCHPLASGKKTEIARAWRAALESEARGRHGVRGGQLGLPSRLLGSMMLPSELCVAWEGDCERTKDAEYVGFADDVEFVDVEKIDALSRFVVDAKGFEFLRVLGFGGFGVVVDATWNGRQCAVKFPMVKRTMEGEEGDRKSMQWTETTTEFERMCKVEKRVGSGVCVRHVAIVSNLPRKIDIPEWKLDGVRSSSLDGETRRGRRESCRDALQKPACAIVMDRYVVKSEHSSLGQWLSGGGEVDIRVRVNMMIDLVGKFREFHRSKIVHRDVKPDNILIACSKDRFFLHIGDLGSCTVHEPGGGEPGASTPAYSPARLGSRSSPDTVDVYALSAVVLETLTQVYPWFQIADGSEVYREDSLFWFLENKSEVVEEKLGSARSLVPTLKSCCDVLKPSEFGDGAAMILSELKRLRSNLVTSGTCEN